MSSTEFGARAAGMTPDSYVEYPRVYQYAEALQHPGSPERGHRAKPHLFVPRRPEDPREARTTPGRSDVHGNFNRSALPRRTPIVHRPVTDAFTAPSGTASEVVKRVSRNRWSETYE